MSSLDLRSIAPGLELGPEGWWTSRTLSKVAYPEEGNAWCFAVEDTSFWFQHRNRCIVEAIRNFPPPGLIFDVGGGNGCVARAILDSGHEVVLVEPGLAGVQNALKRGIRQVVRAAMEDMGAKNETIPAVGLFDVVEHIPDDVGFLTRIHHLLVPGGRVYLTVPAYDWLWSFEDVLAGHSRRYTIETLRRRLESTGYTVDFATYLFEFLPLPILFCRAIPYRLGFAPKVSPNSVRTDHEAQSLLIGRMLGSLTRRELSRIADRRALAWGGSCLVVARKGSAH